LRFQNPNKSGIPQLALILAIQKLALLLLALPPCHSCLLAQLPYTQKSFNIFVEKYIS